MQLFILHRDAALNAQAYPDKYTYNQIRESEQFLRYAIFAASDGEWNHQTNPVNPNNSHINHPTTQWASRAYANWYLAYRFTKAIHEEWKDRYGHPDDKVHKSFARIEEMKRSAEIYTPFNEQEPPVCAFDEQYKPFPEPTTIDEVVENFRTYIREVKSKQKWFKYEKAEPPEFIKPYLSTEETPKADSV